MSNFVVFDALHIDTVFLDAVPQAALVDSQKLGGSDLNAAGFAKCFDNHIFFDFLEAFVQGHAGRRQQNGIIGFAVIESAGDFGG